MNKIFILYFSIIFINLKLILVLTCPSECICNKNTVTCKKKALPGVPKDIPIETTHLDLSQNNIKHLPANSFKNLTNLKFLRLDHNDMKTIDENAFVGLENLRDLYIVQNDLSDLHPETFNKGLNKLLHLYLGNNEFETIPKLKASQMLRLNLDSNKINDAHIDESFLSNTGLLTLVLTKNFIKTIRKTDLINLRNTQLTSLMLKMNSLESIDPEAFVPVRGSLKTLELEGNKQLNSSVIERALAGFSSGSGSMLFLDLKSCGLTNVSAEFFKPFSRSKLHQLDLSSNSQLADIVPTAFEPLTHLQVLRLDHCRLSAADIVFSALAELRKLYLHANQLVESPARLPGSLDTLELHENHIQVVRRQDFMRLTRLKTLQLSRNQIASIEKGSFQDLSSLVTLDLSHNRLSRVGDEVLVGMVALETVLLVKQLPCLDQLGPDTLVLPGLKELKLDENCLGRSSTPLAGVFHNLGALKNLSVTDNRLGRLDNRFLEGLGQLQHLDLSKNELVGWGSRTFLPVVGGLVKLDLSMNRIATVARGCLEAACDNYVPDVGEAGVSLSWGALTSVAMENNAWNCEDCHMIEWLVRHQTVLTKPDHVLCQFPKMLAGLSVVKERANCSSYVVPAHQDHKSLPQVLPHKDQSSSWKIWLYTVLGILGSLTICAIIYYRKKINWKMQRLLKRDSSGYKRFPTISTTNNTVIANDIYPVPSHGDHGYEKFEDDYEGSRLSLGFMETDPVYSAQSPESPWRDAVAAPDSDEGSIDSDIDFVFVSSNERSELSRLENLSVTVLSDLASPGDRRLARRCQRLVIDCPPVHADLLEPVLVARKRDGLPSYLFQCAEIQIDWDSFPLADFFQGARVRYNAASLVNELIKCH